MSKEVEAMSKNLYTPQMALKNFTAGELTYISNIRKNNEVLAKEPELRKLIDDILNQVQNHMIKSYKKFISNMV